MKASAFLLCLLWLSAATYAGYRLTARSFAWVDQPNFGLASAPADTVTPPTSPANLDALNGKVPPRLMEQAKSLSPQQLLCLKASISPDHLQAALRGELTPAEAAAVKNCLK